VKIVSFLGELVFASARGALVGLGDFLLTKYLVTYHGLSWSASGWLVAAWGAWIVSRNVKSSWRRRSLCLASKGVIT
jgi:hypothetical protein